MQGHDHVVGGQVRHVGERLVGHGHEVAVKKGLAADALGRARRDRLGVVDRDALREQGFRGRTRRLGLEHAVQGVLVGAVGVDAVGREAAAQAVGALVHIGDGADDVGAGEAPTAFVHDAHNRAGTDVFKGQNAVAHKRIFTSWVCH